MQRGVLLEELHRLGPGLEEAVDAFGIEMVPGLVLQVDPRLLGIVVDPGAQLRPVAGNPHPPARARGRAAEDRLLFHHQHVEATMRRRDSAGQTARPRSDDQDINFLSFHDLLPCHAAR